MYDAATIAGKVLATPAALALALARLELEDSLALDLLDEDLRLSLLRAADALPYREARPIVGEGDRAVHQDFEICMTFPEPSIFGDFARALESLTNQALALMPRPPLAQVRYNDLAIQRYQPGSQGITPHRDHIRYQGLVALVILAGEARFFVCADRGGAGAREIPSPPGGLVLMRAPGYAGAKTRPFHMLKDVTSYRVSLGLRYDTRADQAAA